MRRRPAPRLAPPRRVAAGEAAVVSAPPGKAGARPGAHELHPQRRLRRGGERYFARPLGRGRACLCGEPAPPFCAAMSGWAGQPPLRGGSPSSRGKGTPERRLLWRRGPAALGAVSAWLPGRGREALLPPPCLGHAELKRSWSASEKPGSCSEGQISPKS